MRDKQKLKVIFAIDHLIKRIKTREEYGLYNYPATKSELINMRKRYIYKDISQVQYNEDVGKIKSLKDIL
jgi:hypothetical protein